MGSDSSDKKSDKMRELLLFMENSTYKLGGDDSDSEVELLNLNVNPSAEEVQQREDENRVAPRVPLDALVVIHSLEGKLLSKASISNISITGLALSAPGPDLQIGQEVHIQIIPKDDQQQALDLNCVVVHTGAVLDILGLKITKIRKLSEKKLQELINSKL